MSKSNWIDVKLSSALPAVRDRGEGQHVEFMKQYPGNGNELSKEVAAFASSNQGSIILGIADDGTLIGLPDLETTEQRDLLCRRIEGLCTNNVKPAVTPVVKFAQEEGKTVLWIEVPRGQQPIYYNKNTPYIRHLSQSRPAEPHEVIERIIEWRNTSPLAKKGEPSPAEDSKSQFFSLLAETLFNLIIFGEEFEDRDIDPWLEQLFFEFRFSGRTLRDLASESTSVDLGLDRELRELADKVDQVENLRLVLSDDSWTELEKCIGDVAEGACRIKAEQIDTIPLSDSDQAQLLDSVGINARRLADLSDRAPSAVKNGRIEDVQSEASRIGYELLRVSHYWISDRPEHFSDELRNLGRELHLFETEYLEMDGGLSMQRILERLKRLSARLEEFVLRDE